MLDSNPGLAGYQYMFGVLGLVALLGGGVALILQRRIRGGIADRIALQVSDIDSSLDLQGEEKTLSQLIDKSGGEGQ